MKRVRIIWRSSFVLFAALLLSVAVCQSAQASDNADVHYDSATNTLYIPSGTVDASAIYNEGAGIHASEMTTVVFEGDTQIEGTADLKNEGMFLDCTALTEVQVLGKVSFTGERPALKRMFEGCTSLKQVDLSNFDTSNVVNMSYMFTRCEALESLNISSFNTEKVEEFDSMFSYCSKLTSLDLSSFSYQKPYPGEEGGEKLFDVFACCDNLKELHLGKIMFPGPSHKGMYPDIDAFASVNEDSEGVDVIMPLPCLSKVTMYAGCLPSPLVYNDKLEYYQGSYFDYNHPGGWNAYQDGVYQAHLESYDDFANYQNTHPGFTTYTWATEPGPEPTPGTEEGWVQSDAGWQYVLNGEYLNDGWHYFEDEYGNHWYYFDPDTYLATSRWIWDDAWEGWYWVCSTGPMIENLWQWIDNAWYGFWWGGKMCQGWVWDTYYVAWYYCDDYTGRVACSEWAWDGAWYYFDQNCRMLTNCWVGDYWLNEHGMWI